MSLLLEFCTRSHQLATDHHNIVCTHDRYGILLSYMTNNITKQQVMPPLLCCIKRRSTHIFVVPPLTQTVFEKQGIFSKEALDSLQERAADSSLLKKNRWREDRGTVESPNVINKDDMYVIFRFNHCSPQFRLVNVDCTSNPHIPPETYCSGGRSRSATSVSFS